MHVRVVQKIDFQLRGYANHPFFEIWLKFGDNFFGHSKKWGVGVKAEKL